MGAATQAEAIARNQSARRIGVKPTARAFATTAVTVRNGCGATSGTALPDYWNTAAPLITAPTRLRPRSRNRSGPCARSCPPLRKRCLFPDDELHLGDEAHDQLAVRADRIQQVTTPPVDFRLAFDEDMPDQGLEGLCQGAVRNVAFVLVELACREKPTRRD